MPERPTLTGAERSRTVTTGFRPLSASVDSDDRPIYRVVEIVRDSEGRLRHEGRVWHSDLTLLRKFGRAVAANTRSHRVLIADSVGEIVEELPITPPEDRQAAWDRWEALPLPPQPTLPATRRAAVAAQAAAEAAAKAAQAAVRTPLAPPRNIPRLPVEQATDLAEAVRTLT
ncbi:hypothetical protein [Rhizobacter sp. LjRoot28]|uniref:hypothetical protein n=1 Tax=Rhizobacter sp. LjRoot28 TaxID=3342309 RepID=UPI003ECD20D1